MKPHAEDRKQREAEGKASGPGLDDVSQKPAAQPTAEQKRVLDCLHAAGGGLTLRQLQAMTGFSDAALQEALEDLVSRSLIARLNTLIPSYAQTYPGIRLYPE